MKKIMLCCALLVVAACQQPPEMNVYEPVRFIHLPQMQVNAATINVIDNYESPLTRPYVDHLFPVSLEKSVNQWANDRLVSAGENGRLEIVIVEASVVEIDLPVTKGIKGAFKNEQAQRYDANLVVDIKLYDGERSLAVAQSRVEVRQSRSIDEKATIEQREKLFYTIARGMMQLFDAEMERQIHQHFSNYISYKRIR